MREFIYFSSKARTSGVWKDLMQAGRMDIVCNAVIHSFFISNAMRDDVILHLIFYGQPTPPRHIELTSRAGEVISKKDIAGLIKRILFKYKEDKNTEVFPGCFIEKKNLMGLIGELKSEGKKIYILDKGGKDVRDIATENLKEAVFLLGDHEGLPKKELKRLKKEVGLVSLGKKTYFASQSLVILHNELDRR